MLYNALNYIILDCIELCSSLVELNALDPYRPIRSLFDSLVSRLDLKIRDSVPT